MGKWKENCAIVTARGVVRGQHQTLSGHGKEHRAAASQVVWSRAYRGRLRLGAGGGGHTVA